MTDQLTTTDVARLAGITTASFRRYRLRGTAPTPDGHMTDQSTWSEA